MTYFLDHIDLVWTRTVQHTYLAGLPLVLGLLIALPLGWLARRYRIFYVPFTAGFGLLYTIPSLALFVLLPGILHTQILDPVNVIVAMTLYTVALLVRTVADGLGAVPDHVSQAATAMGFTRVKRVFAVELPLAVPVIAAGMRVAAVSNVSIVSVATIIGVPQLGLFFSDGFSRDYYDPLIVGIVACIVLALCFDLIIIGVTWLLTPWLRASGARS
jgi:osmoprotectant transport system permease protein